MRESNLPHEFQFLNGRVHYVRQVTRNEWSSSCPQCGGAVHQNGEFPDRFRMWTNARGKNAVIGWCRHCGFVAFPDTDKPLNPAEVEKWRLEQIERERRIKAEAEIAIKNLQSEKLWESYHAQLNEWSWNIIQGWGISKEWADYWQLGLIPDYLVRRKDEAYHSPGITIPLWQRSGDVGNIKVRVMNPKDANDRYRSIYKVGQPFVFHAIVNDTFKTAFVAEGEKKAMVVAQWLTDKMQVIGVPTKTPNKNMLSEALDRYDRVVVCLDPDAKIKDENGSSPLRRMVDMIGRERTQVLNLPFKVDDMIVKHGLDIKDALRYVK